jgi:hypothetical protein
MEKCNEKLYNNINKKTMANRCHFSHQKQDKKRGCLKIICQKLINCCWELRDQIRPNVSRAEAEKTTKVALRLAKHAIGTLFSNQPDAIRMLQTEPALKQKSIGTRKRGQRMPVGRILQLGYCELKSSNGLQTKQNKGAETTKAKRSEKEKKIHPSFSLAFIPLPNKLIFSQYFSLSTI